MCGSACARLVAVVGVQAADGLVQGVEDGGAVLGEQVPVDVLGRLDLAVSHLPGYLHVGCAGRDEQRGADVPQLVHCIANGAVGVRGGIAVGEPEVSPPHGVAEVADAVGVAAR